MPFITCDNCSFTRLHNEGWVSNDTRAITIEFNVYNAFINMFAVGARVLHTISTCS
jgi:hypothetical protein